MNDPKTPNEEPRRVSAPNQPGMPNSPQPDIMPPQEQPEMPQTEYEREVPHSPNQPVAMSGEKGEGSYKGTQQYKEGYDKFKKDVSPDAALQKAKQINPDQPDLKAAEEKGKSKSGNGGAGGRISVPSIH